MDDQEQPKGFQVRDRRRFTETGETRSEAEAEAAPASPAASEEAKAEIGGEPQPAPGREDVPLEISLSTFLMSLSTQALMCLGDIPNPMTGKPEPDLTAVRELIDIISMLQEKTRGNLDAQETRLFEKILFDLRMRFVEKSRK
jgi:hypothetical protein